MTQTAKVSATFPNPSLCLRTFDKGDRPHPLREEADLPVLGAGEDGHGAVDEVRLAPRDAVLGVVSHAVVSCKGRAL